nr:hypothetical protein [Peptostreptococcus anaerobius]
MTTVRNKFNLTAFGTDKKSAAIIRVTATDQSVDVVHNNRPRLENILNFFVMLKAHLLNEVTARVQLDCFFSKKDPLIVHVSIMDEKWKERKPLNFPPCQ